MGFDDLRSILLTERETGKLIPISPDIFDRTHAEIADLLKKVYAIEDPLSDEARALIEETIAIRETMHQLFSIRSRKIVALALTHSEGNYYDREEVKRMLPAEREMFDRITAGLLDCQDTLLHAAKLPLVPLTSPDETFGAPMEDAGEPAGSDDAEGSEPKANPLGTSPDSPHLTPPYTLVRVLQDMDTFMGIDGRNYSLIKGDVVTLPERNASVLRDRNLVLAIALPPGK